MESGAWARGGADLVPEVSASDLYLVFGLFAASMAAVTAYMYRDRLLNRRTAYEGSSLGSRRDRDYEKYHSGWHGDPGAGGAARRPPGAGGDDPYEVLGVGRGASAAEIKARYRELARSEHPDRARGGPSRMARINRAYETLSDPERRAEYDGRSGGHV